MPDIKGIWVSREMISATLATLRPVDDKSRKDVLRAAHGHGRIPAQVREDLTVRGVMRDEVKAVVLAYVREDGSLRDKPE